jgi:hypothetical protein
MNRPLKIFAAIFGGIILILLVTNPSKNDFADFLGKAEDTPTRNVLIFKMKDNFIFSNYDYMLSDKNVRGSYVGIFGRFYLVRGEKYHWHGK